MMMSDNDNVFVSFFRKITNIVERQRNKEPDIINRHRWHLTTLLNTFNSYHCYDIHYDHTREIEPFWFTVMDKGVSSFTRLMAITLDKTGFVFWVDHERAIVPIVYDRFIHLVRNIVRDNKNKRYQHKGYPEYILYKDFEESPRYAPPLSNNVVYMSDDVFIEPQYDAFFIEWHVNMKYVPHSRTTNSSHVKHPETPTPFVLPSLPKTDPRRADDRVSLEYVAYLKTYLFGSDWSFIGENFIGDVYTPATALEWNIAIERELGKYGMLDKFIFSHDVATSTLKRHDDTTFKVNLIVSIRLYDSTLLNYELLINDYSNIIYRILGEKVVDIVLPLPQNTPDYMLLDRDVLEYLCDQKKKEIMATEYIIEDSVRRIERLLSS